VLGSAFQLNEDRNAQATFILKTVPFTGPIGTPTNNIRFGYDPAYSGDFYQGLIAGVVIYTRALTSGEVSTTNGL
jgi:hypothetical protein